MPDLNETYLSKRHRVDCKRRLRTSCDLHWFIKASGTQPVVCFSLCCVNCKLSRRGFWGQGISSNNLSLSGWSWSVRLLRTKTPSVPSVAHCQTRGISFERFPQPWQYSEALLWYYGILLFAASFKRYPAEALAKGITIFWNVESGLR